MTRLEHQRWEWMRGPRSWLESDRFDHKRQWSGRARSRPERHTAQTLTSAHFVRWHQ